MAAPTFPVSLGTLPSATSASGTWRALYPEFDTAPDALVQGWLDIAANRIDTAVWGVRAGEGHCLLTAHLLATSPFGQMSRMSSAAGESVYGVRFAEACQQVAMFALRVI